MFEHLSFETYYLYLALLLPGFISIQVYRLLMPVRSASWNESVLQALFYSTLNFGLLFPLFYLGLRTERVATSPYAAALGIAIGLVVAPATWPLVVRRILRSQRIMRSLQLPYPTAWDFYFDKRKPCFILVHLRTGTKIGGYFGSSSYAGDYPNDGDLYLECVYSVDGSGTFGRPIPSSCGLLVRRDEYTHIELFGVPRKEN